MQPGVFCAARAHQNANLELDFISQEPDEKPLMVMARTEWFKFLKLAFDELLCEYPAFLTPTGISFVVVNNVSNVDCVDRELLV